MQTDFKPTLLAGWFGASTITLLFSIFLLFYLSTPRLVLPQNQNFAIFAAIPSSSIQVQDGLTTADARPKIIENFFQGYKSPLTNYAKIIVEVSDKRGLDWRLLAAISMQESNGGVKVIKDSHNPFGYGIYKGLTLKFSSWEEAIERVGRALREDYLDKGLKTPTQIMAKYTPPSLEKGGAWAKGVSGFMEELR